MYISSRAISIVHEERVRRFEERAERRRLTKAAREIASYRIEALQTSVRRIAPDTEKRVA